MGVGVTGAGVGVTGATVGITGVGVGVTETAVGVTGATVGITGMGVGVAGAAVGVTDRFFIAEEGSVAMWVTPGVIGGAKLPPHAITTRGTAPTEAILTIQRIIMHILQPHA